VVAEMALLEQGVLVKLAPPTPGAVVEALGQQTPIMVLGVQAAPVLFASGGLNKE
jgi:hypothetical protein